MTTPTLLPGMRIVIRLPIDRLVSAEILGSRYYTSRNNGRTSFVYDYVYEDGRTSFATVEEIARENPTLFAPLAAPAAKPAPRAVYILTDNDDLADVRLMTEAEADAANKAISDGNPYGWCALHRAPPAPAAKCDDEHPGALAAIAYAIEMLKSDDRSLEQHAPAIQTLQMIVDQRGTESFDPNAETLCDLIDIIVFG